MSFFTGFGVSALVYIVLNQIFPVQGANSKFEEVDDSEALDDYAARSTSSVTRDVTYVDEDDMKKVKNDV